MQLGSAAGAGAIIGSFLGGRIMAAGYSAKATFGAAAILAALQLVMDVALVPETLLETKKKPFDMKFPYSELSLAVRLSEAKQNRLSLAHRTCLRMYAVVVANPLVFMKLFRRTKALRMLSLTAGLQCVPEGKK